MMSESVGEMQKYEFFSGLEPKHLEQIAGCASEKDYEAGSTIFQEGEKADKLFLIRKGKIVIELQLPNRDPLKILTIEKGGVVGWSWLFPPYKWHFQARVLEPTSAVVIDSKCLIDMCEKDHAFGYNIMKRTSQLILNRLEGTTQQLLGSFDIA
jgi:CRP/FNR family transcriptional regulator, cyclic AMP receptor protein